MDLVKVAGQRSGRAKSRRNPLLHGRPKNIWHGDIAHLIPGYPKTQEAFDALRERSRKIMTDARARGVVISRKGVPDGFARRGRRSRASELDQIRDRAAAEAKEIVKHMAANGMITTEDPRAEEALECAVGIIRAEDGEGSPVYQARERLAASKILLEFLKVKPVAKSEVSVHKAEDFLAALAAEAKAG